MPDPTPDPIPDRGGVDEHGQPLRHDPVYDTLHETEEFQELRRRFRKFAFPATVGFLAWYLLYVLLSNWASDFMGHKLFGNINVALVFGLMQFATTFALAFAYARYMNRQVDPIARQLETRYDQEARR